ncbi:MAG: AraC family transcriptional regulator [Clostridiales bacterium]|nr:AraC family transcriptional regulator [Clostridiales bacterium]
MRRPAYCNPSPPGIGVLCTASNNYSCIVYPHYHLEYELSIVLSGVHLLILDGETLRLQTGNILLLRPEEVHSRKMEVPGKYIAVTLPAAEVDAMARYLGDGMPARMLRSGPPPSAVLSPTEIERYVHRIERVNLFCATDEQRALAELRALLVDLCFYRLAGADESASDRTPWLRKLLQGMEKPENIRRGLPAILEMTPYSHEYLCREFKRMMGMTPTEYINGARLNLALRMLQSPEHDIVDICYAVGFESVSYFYHLFKAKFGNTPNRYRKNHLIAYPSIPPEQFSALAE